MTVVVRLNETRRTWALNTSDLPSTITSTSYYIHTYTTIKSTVGWYWSIFDPHLSTTGRSPGITSKMADPPPPAAQPNPNSRPTTTTEGSSTNSSPSMLPYLRDSTPSPQSTLNSSTTSPKVPGPRAGPSLINLSNTIPPSTSTSTSSAPLSATSSSSTSSKAKKRPKPLVLGRQEIGQDEELTAQLRTDGRWSARSGITIISPRKWFPLRKW